MELVEIARVAVSAAPYAIDKPYDYRIPEELEASAVPGVRVTVSFGRGNQSCEGIILARERREAVPGLKWLAEVLDESPVLDGDALRLALWLRQRYFCTVYDAVKAMLPAGLLCRLREIWHINRSEIPAEALPSDPSGQIELWAAGTGTKPSPEAAVLSFLHSCGGKAEYAAIRTACGEVRSVLRDMERRGVLRREALPRRKPAGRSRRMAELAVPVEDALAMAERRRKSSPVRYEVVKFLSAAGRASLNDIAYYTGAEAKQLERMERSGLLKFSPEDPPVPPQTGAECGASTAQNSEIVLNGEQQRAFETVRSLMERRVSGVVLLHGVTGSGKTLVYLRLVQEALDAGRTAMVLVPEIVLTPQMMRRFSACFGDGVVMLHSSLRTAERAEQWKRVSRGEAGVVLGTRSAVFAPLRNLGLIVMDEEQEGSYQSEASPRYHTRDVAKYLCARDHAVLLLGSATPTVETAWAAEQGRYQKVTLRERYNRQELPHVLIADMRRDLRDGQGGVLGRDLRRELEENLSRGEQSILFLNRRGSSRMLLCGECGYVPECPRCSVPMTFHSANRRLMCHHCGFSRWAEDPCPRCGGLMKRVGFGTQRVEEELGERFPGAAVLRMDADTAGGSQEKFLAKFEKERIPILLGTQMVAKGLDFENVTLVGVLSADLSLYVDSYRAAERTFSLLTQVVGRAGRGRKRGRAVIQTYTPGNDVIQSAAEQDYARFYEAEIRLRALRRCPPFADLFTLTVTGVEEEQVLRGAGKVRETLRTLIHAGALGVPVPPGAPVPTGGTIPPGMPVPPGTPVPSVGELPPVVPDVLGPAPAPILKINNRYRYRVILTARNSHAVREALSRLLREFARDSENRGLNLFVDCNGMD